MWHSETTVGLDGKGRGSENPPVELEASFDPSASTMASVTLAVYDLSKGMARQLSQQILGIEIEYVMYIENKIKMHGQLSFFVDLE
jgi:hypothetical protein